MKKKSGGFPKEKIGCGRCGKTGHTAGQCHTKTAIDNDNVGGDGRLLRSRSAIAKVGAFSKDNSAKMIVSASPAEDVSSSTPSFANTMMKKKSMPRPIFNSNNSKNGSSSSHANSIILKPYEELLKHDMFMKLDFMKKMQSRSLEVTGRRNITSFHDVSRIPLLGSGKKDDFDVLDDDRSVKTHQFSPNSSTTENTRNVNCRDIAYLSYLLENTKIEKLGIVDSELNYSELGAFLSSKFMLAGLSKGSTTCLLELDLKHNNIGVKGLFILANAFAESCGDGAMSSGNQLRSLRRLNLSDNRLVGIHVSRKQVIGIVDTKGVDSLFQSLLHNDTLEWLDLSCNYLGGVVNNSEDVSLLTPSQRVAESIHNNNTQIYTSSINGNRAVGSEGSTIEGVIGTAEKNLAGGVRRSATAVNSANKVSNSSSSSSSGSSSSSSISALNSDHQAYFHQHSSILYDDSSEQFLNNTSYGPITLTAILTFLTRSKHSRMKVLNLNSNAFNYPGDRATQALFHDIYKALYSNASPSYKFASVCGIDYTQSLSGSSGGEVLLDLTYADLSAYSGMLLAVELISNSNICIGSGVDVTSSTRTTCSTAGKNDTKAAPAGIGHTQSSSTPYPFGSQSEVRDISATTTLDLSNNIDFRDGVSSLLDTFLDFHNSSYEGSDEVTYSNKFNIKKLNFRNTNISVTSIQTLGTVIQNRIFESLVSLNLSCNRRLGDAGVQLLCSPIQSIDTIRHLSLSSCSITKDGAAYVGALLLHMIHAGAGGDVCRIDLSLNNLERNGFEVISRALVCDDSSRDFNVICNSLELDVSFNNIRSKLSPDKKDSLGDTVIPLTPYTVDHLQRRRQLFSFLKDNSFIASFNFCGNPICGSRVESQHHDLYDPWPILQMADYLLTTGCRLGSLDLSNIDIGARSTRKLFTEVFTTNTNLRYLNICHSNISEQGAIAVGEALPRICGLKTLLMSSCGIGPLGCQELLAGLARNTSIQKIDLSNNQISGYLFADERDWDYDVLTVDAIKTTFLANSTLTDVDLSFNRLFAYSLSDNITTLVKPNEDTIPKSNNCDTAIRLLVEGVEGNEDIGGGLKRLNIVGNRIRPCMKTALGQGCKQCSDYLRLKAYSLPNPPPPESLLSRYVDSSHYCYCFMNEAVTGLIEAMENHRSLVTLLGVGGDGIGQRDGCLDLSGANMDEHLLRILSHELRYNQSISSLNLEGNSNISEQGFHLLLDVIGSNISLKSTRLPLILSANMRHGNSVDSISSLHTAASFNALDARLQLYKNDKSLVNSGIADICGASSVYAAKLKAFNYRMIIIYWIRSHHFLGNLPLHMVLEFIIGGGPKVRWLLNFVSKY